MAMKKPTNNHQLRSEFGVMQPGSILAVAATIGVIAFGAAKMSGPDPNGCDTQLENPASWVLCPLVDGSDALVRGGTAITRTVFDAITYLQPKSTDLVIP